MTKLLGTAAVFGSLATLLAGCRAPEPPPRRKGVVLEDLTWPEAEKRLRPDAVVVFPLGAASKEHGPHLRLRNDLTMAERLTEHLLAREDVVVAPTIAFSYYPAFVDYPGSISLRLETARDLVVDAVRSVARHGPKRFYVLNTGVSTVRALQAASDELAEGGIVLRFTDLLATLGPIEKRIAKQARGTHADELETSIMLFLAPGSVDMTKAVKDDAPDRPGPLTRDPNGAGLYSPSGVWGDATLATREKGRELVEALDAGISADIAALRTATPETRR